MRAQLREAALVAVAFFLLLLAGCGGASSNNQAGNPGTPNPGGNNNGGGNGGGGTGGSSPASKFLYIMGGERGDQNFFLDTFAINPDTGVLTPVAGELRAPEVGFQLIRSPQDFSFYTSGAIKAGVAGYLPSSTGVPQLVSRQGQDNGFLSMSPDGKFLIVSSLNGLHVYSASQGNLSEVAGSPLVIPQHDFSAVVPGAGGRFYFATGQNSIAFPGSTPPDSRIYVFSMAANGALTQVSTTPALPADSDYGIPVVDNSGRFLYVLELPFVSNASPKPLIHVFSIDQNSGVLTEVSGSPFPFTSVGSDRFFINQVSIGPNNILYVIASTNRQIFAYSISSTNGAPVLIGAFPVQDHPHVITFDRSGRFAYVLQHDDAGTRNLITTYAIGANGSLTPISGPPANGSCCTGIGLQNMMAD